MNIDESKSENLMVSRLGTILLTVLFSLVFFGLILVTMIIFTVKLGLSSPFRYVGF
jgi:hypothetical protein